MFLLSLVQILTLLADDRKLVEVDRTDNPLSIIGCHVGLHGSSSAQDWVESMIKVLISGDGTVIRCPVTLVHLGTGQGNPRIVDVVQAEGCRYLTVGQKEGVQTEGVNLDEMSRLGSTEGNRVVAESFRGIELETLIGQNSNRNNRTN